MSAVGLATSLVAMKRDPRGGWTVDDVAGLCRGLGIRCVLPDADRCHCVVSHHQVEGLLTLPARRPIKPVYIMLLVQLIESVLDRR